MCDTDSPYICIEVHGPQLAKVDDAFAKDVKVVVGEIVVAIIASSP